jgi:polyphosphate kinase
MERNFFRRIELAFPILDPKLKKRVITEGLKFYLADNQQGWDMNSVGAYQRRRSARAKPHNAQAVNPEKRLKIQSQHHHSVLSDSAVSSFSARHRA